MTLCIQTLFLPRESIFYMEEWLVYHTLLGFDKFRLYDNTGSSGDAQSAFRKTYGSSSTKYGLPMVSQESTDEDLQNAVMKICGRFNVEIVPWSSELYTNEVQIKAVTNHCQNDDSEYTAFIDMDEYVCVGGEMNIKEFMEVEVKEKGYCGVRMSQQKMPHILGAKMSDQKRVWELTDTFQMETRGWAPKSILSTKGTMEGVNIHELRCRGAMLDQPERKIIKFNHYNTNEYQMHWLRKNHMKYDPQTPFNHLFLGQSEDRSLDNFKEKMSQWDYLNLEEI